MPVSNVLPPDSAERWLGRNADERLTRRYRLRVESGPGQNRRRPGVTTAPTTAAFATGDGPGPAKAETQRFMLDYVREMPFEFYPNADGLLIESSDYAICHCANCRDKFFDNEFRFVRAISDELWRRKPDATIVVDQRIVGCLFSGDLAPSRILLGRRVFSPRCRRSGERRQPISRERAIK
jgi:hypothetical protein